MDLKELVIKRERKIVKQATMINHNKAIVKIEHRMKTSLPSRERGMKRAPGEGDI